MKKMLKMLWIPNNNEGFARENQGDLLSAENFEKRVHVSEPGIRVWEDVNPYEFKKDFKRLFKKLSLTLNIELNIYDNNNKLIVGDLISFEDLLALEELSLDTKFELLDLLVGSEGKYYCNEFAPYGKYLAYELYGSNSLIEEEQFFSADGMDYVEVYEYWDGSNWRIKDNFNVTEYEIELTEEKYNLDVFDGRNRTWGGPFSHARLEKVAKVDGGDVEDTILWWSWTQMQGQIDTGELMSHDEVITRLTKEEHPELAEIKKWLEGGSIDG